MDFLETYIDESEASSQIQLLELGLNCFRQGRYAEGVSFCALACSQLPAEQALFATMIEAFLELQAQFQQAQQALQQVSACFAEMEARQQAILITIEQLFSTPRKEIDTPPPLHHQIKPSDKNDRLRLVHTQETPVRLNGEQTRTPYKEPQDNQGTLPALSITCFGRFEVKRFGETLPLCQNRNGQAILRYLVAQANYCATMDTLMDVLWPDDKPEVARHKVQVAVSALRRTLNHGFTCDSGGGYILCQNGVYRINPIISITTDVDIFLSLYQAGRQSKGGTAIAHFEKACRLYSGPFLVEDIYSDWSFALREQLGQSFITMCHALADYSLSTGHCEASIQWASAILKENQCNEVAHRQLMRAYAACGQRSEALRQFQRCERILLKELGATPMSETARLFQSILHGEIAHRSVNRNRAEIE